LKQSLTTTKHLWAGAAMVSRFVAGTSNMKCGVISHPWYKLPKLIGLDVSRTDIGPTAVSRLLSLSPNLKVLYAMNCQVLQENNTFSVNKFKGKLLVALFTDIFKGLASLFVNATKMGEKYSFGAERR
jgi:hypothetical protein